LSFLLLLAAIPPPFHRDDFAFGAAALAARLLSLKAARPPLHRGDLSPAKRPTSDAFWHAEH
jgi:hypothetical protein